MPPSLSWRMGAAVCPARGSLPARLGPEPQLARGPLLCPPLPGWHSVPSPPAGTTSAGWKLPEGACCSRMCSSRPGGLGRVRPVHSRRLTPLGRQEGDPSRGRPQREGSSLPSQVGEGTLCLGCPMCPHLLPASPQSLLLSPEKDRNVLIWRISLAQGGDGSLLTLPL